MEAEEHAQLRDDQRQVARKGEAFFLAAKDKPRQKQDVEETNQTNQG